MVGWGGNGNLDELLLLFFVLSYFSVRLYYCILLMALRYDGGQSNTIREETHKGVCWVNDRTSGGCYGWLLYVVGTIWRIFVISSGGIM